MGRCPQCKTALQVPETSPTIQPSDQIREAESTHRPLGETPPLPPNQPKARPPPANIESAPTPSSKQHATRSRLEAQTNDRQPYISPISRRQSSNRLRQAPAPPSLLPPPTPKPPSTSGLSRANANALIQPMTKYLTKSTSFTHPQPPNPRSETVHSAKGIERHRGTLISLDLQGSYKSSTRKNPSGNDSTRRPDWVRTAERMIEDVPLGRDWQQALSKKDSSLLAAVVLDKASNTEADLSSQKADGKTEHLVQLVRGFARRHSEGCIMFEQFILVCMCNVLSDQGVPRGEIVQTLQICISDTSRKNVLTYLRGSIWVNELINDMSFTQWGYRAIDLIVLCQCPYYSCFTCLLRQIDRESAHFYLWQDGFAT